MRRFVFSILVLSFIAGCASAEPKQPAMETEDQKTMYALGVALARQLGGAAFDEAEVELIQLGLSDGIRGGDTKVAMDVYGPLVNTLMQSRVAAATDREKQAGQEYCDSMANEEGARRTASGAVYIEVAAGEGPSPAASDSVKVHYHGTLRDGTVFDSSVQRGEPATFGIGGVVPCFREGLQEMKVGGKAKLVCPADTAYGDRGSPPNIKPGAALVFEVELLEIVAGE
jgi:FKBP-type peptidyl-prolyl cis-trans isomerase FkpA/FKBP-type peptidyl-prolyl cis-trans isomerase FklB